MSLLNDADDVLLGTQGVAAVYRGNQMVWPRPLTACDLVSDQQGNLVVCASDSKLWVGVKNINVRFECYFDGSYVVADKFDIAHYGEYEANAYDESNVDPGYREIKVELRTQNVKIPMMLSVEVEVLDGLSGQWVTTAPGNPPPVMISTGGNIYLAFWTTGQTPGEGTARLTITLQDNDQTITKVFPIRCTVLPPLGTNTFDTGVAAGTALQVVPGVLAMTARWEGSELVVDVPGGIVDTSVSADSTVPVGYVRVPGASMPHPYKGPAISTDNAPYPYGGFWQSMKYSFSTPPVNGYYEWIMMHFMWETDDRPEEIWMYTVATLNGASGLDKKSYLSFSNMLSYNVDNQGLPGVGPGKWKINFNAFGSSPLTVNPHTVRIDFSKYTWEIGTHLPTVYDAFPLSLSTSHQEVPRSLPVSDSMPELTAAPMKQELTAVPAETPAYADIETTASPRESTDTSYLISSDADNVLVASPFDGKVYLGSAPAIAFSDRLAARRKQGTFTPADLVSSESGNHLTLGNDQKLKVRGVPTGQSWGMDYFGQPPLDVKEKVGEISAAWNGSDLVFTFDTTIGDTTKLGVGWALGPGGVSPHPSWDSPWDMASTMVDSWNVVFNVADTEYAQGSIIFGWSAGYGFGYTNIGVSKNSSMIGDLPTWSGTNHSLGWGSGRAPSLGYFYAFVDMILAGKGTCTFKTSECRFSYVPK